MKMKIKIKKLVPEAIIPKYAKPGDAGMDLTATSKVFDEYGNVSYGTGLAFEIPEGYVGLLFPRSSNCKKELLLSNSVGILDSEFRGQLIFKFKPTAVFSQNLPKNYYDSNQYYEVGDRIGQILILPYPQIEFEEVEELSITERNDGGFGSTGK